MSQIIVEPFTLDHCRALGADIRSGTLNIVSGPAYTLIKEGRILAAGGVRTAGIGEAWACIGPEAQAHKKTLLRTARAVIEQCIKSERLYSVFAYPSVDKPAWFEHLGFRSVEMLVR